MVPRVENNAKYRVSWQTTLSNEIKPKLELSLDIASTGLLGDADEDETQKHMMTCIKGIQ